MAKPHSLKLQALKKRYRRLGLGVITDFNKLRMDTSAKNIAAWMPVIAKIVQGFYGFSDKAVRIPHKHPTNLNTI